MRVLIIIIILFVNIECAIKLRKYKHTYIALSLHQIINLTKRNYIFCNPCEPAFLTIFFSILRYSFQNQLNKKFFYDRKMVAFVYWLTISYFLFIFSIDKI